ncbi:MAG TPA: hypothetical protein VFC23_13855, partial [Thermoanaerobaculia bacterium]|nr:hypothetical protein [Thermoanaerobaculia bacterium]
MNDHCLLAQDRARGVREERTAERRIAAQLLSDMDRTCGDSDKCEVALFLAALGLLARRYGAQEPLSIATAALRSVAGEAPDPL